jgi:hypothetical protein
MDSLTIIYIVLGAVMFFALAVPGVLMILFSIRVLRERRKLQTWQQTAGRVLSTDIHEEKRSTGRMGFMLDIRRITVYVPVVNYAYQVGNRDYQSGRIKFDWQGNWAVRSLGEAQTVLNDYPASKEVTVFYDPTNPAQAVLEREQSAAGMLAVRWVGVAFLAAAAVILALGANALIQNIAAQVNTAAIQTSGGVLAPSASVVKSTLERDLKLVCQSEGFAGVKIAYRGWRCTSSGEVTGSVDLYARRDEPEKLDLVWAVVTRANTDKDLAFLMKLVAAADPQSDRDAVQKWLTGAIPALQQKGSRVSQDFKGISYTVDTTSGSKVNFTIGSSR